MEGKNTKKRKQGMDAKNGKKRKQDREVPMANNDHAIGILRSLRDVPPAHYTLKIESFSLFLNTKIENYESGVFEAGGYKWKLSLYPIGNKKRNANGHISLYLAIADVKNLPLGWEVNVNFKLFVFNHIQDKYLTIQDAEGVRRFHRLKTEWGFDQLLPLNTFNDASNGYLLDDCCVFGAEVFVIKYNGKGDCLSMMKDLANNAYTWKINKFSAIDEIFLFSEEFAVGEHKWKLLIYPKGNGNAEGKSLSLFLHLADCGTTLPNERQLYAEYKLRIRDQLHGLHFESKVANWFSSASCRSFGYRDFLSLIDLNNASKGFMVNDDVIVEAQIMLMSSCKDL